MAETQEKRVPRGVMLLLIGAKYLCQKINEYEVRLKPKLGDTLWSTIKTACEAVDLMYEGLQIWVDARAAGE